MISVQNRRPPSNGSSMLLMALGVLMLLAVPSCSTKKKVPAKDDDRKEKPEAKDNDEKQVLDTVEWNVIREPEPPPIESKDEERSDRVIGEDYYYDLNLVLPLGTSSMFIENEDGERQQLRDFQNQLLYYYAGVKLALDQLDSLGFKVRATAFDSRDEKLEDILEEVEVKEGTVLMGGVGESSVKTLADFARDNSSFYASPWLPDAPFTGDNPWFVQLNPSLETYLQKAYSTALGDFEPEQITVVGTVDNMNRIDRMERIISGGGPHPIQMRKLVVESSADFLDLTAEDLNPRDERHAYILTETNNYHFIHDFFRQLGLLGLVEQSTIYGLTAWDSEILYDYMNSFELYIVNPELPGLTEDYVTFARKFYREYHAVPTPKAVEGYNHCLAMFYFLKEEGAYDPESVPPLFQGVQAAYLLKPHQVEGLEGNVNPAPQKYFENIFLYVLEFVNYEYKVRD